MKVRIRKARLGLGNFQKHGVEIEVYPMSENSIVIVSKAMRHFYPNIHGFAAISKVGVVGSSIFMCLTGNYVENKKAAKPILNYIKLKINERKRLDDKIQKNA